MIDTIKKWINWPAKGVNNGTDLVNWAKANWLTIIIILIGILIAYWIIKKVVGLVVSIFRD